MARKARKTTVETTEFAAFMRRIMRALGRRVSEGDIDSLTEITRLQAELDALLVTTVVNLRSEPWNYSWAQIGTALGTTRQAAQIRFGKHMPADTGRKVGGQTADLR